MGLKRERSSTPGCLALFLGALAGALAGVPLVTCAAFFFLANRLGPYFNGHGESGLASILFVPGGAAWGAFAGAAVTFGVILARSRRANTWQRGLLADVAIIGVGIAGFMVSCAAAGFLLQFSIQG